MEHADRRWRSPQSSAGPLQCGRPPRFKEDRVPVPRGR
nr:MAG TPA: hypothetical protein [Caudoviricetes sp.]